MSLYFDAAAAIENAEKIGGSLKSRIYGNKSAAKSQPAQIYALVTESTKWSPVLKEVVQKSQLLEHEKKLTPVLATLLVHDLLLAKRGVAAPRNHALNVAVSKHKARLASEFTRLRLKRGYPTVELFRKAVDDGKLGGQEGEALNGASVKAFRHPRWVRINRVQTSLDTQLATTFAKFRRVDDLKEMLTASKNEQSLCLDQNVPDLVALPPGYELSKSQAYLSGDIIVQDKASCFPAYLLDVDRDNGDVIDACAAPGNKTTHLAAFCAVKPSSTWPRKVHAFEKDVGRTNILTKMVHKAGASSIVSIHGTTDFMTVDVNDPIYQNVTSILLDPSCSGSGIVGRDDELSMELPEAKPATQLQSKKRKRSNKDEGKPKAQQVPAQAIAENDTEAENQSSTQRLEALAAFQSKLLQHAMSFPSATRIVYSTCSIHAEENESVVIRALSSPIGVERGWKILSRAQQVSGMKAWDYRGDIDACSQALKSVHNGVQRLFNENEIAEGCIRCEKNGESGTIGFFVAGFTRDAGFKSNHDISGNDFETETEQDEWNGCSDSE